MKHKTETKLYSSLMMMVDAKNLQNFKQKFLRCSVLLCLLIVAPVLSQNGGNSDENGVSTESSDETPQENLTQPVTEAEPSPTGDMKIIAEILEDAEKYKPSYEDSSALQAKKKRQLKKKISEIIKKNIGKSLNFSGLQVSDVEPEKELTAYGRTRAKSIIRQLKKDPQARAFIEAMGEDIKDNYFLRFAVALQLATCKKCMRSTGRFEIKFFVPEQGEFSHTVFKTVNSESAALKYSKGAVYPVSGTIAFIEIDENIVAKIIFR